MTRLFCLFILILCQLSFSNIESAEQQLEMHNNSQCDLIIFSYDRPMQLFALLESVENHAQHIRKIAVLCRISPSFEKGYKIIRQRFPDVHFVQQSNQNPKSDFKPHLLELLLGNFGEGADYVAFAVDDIIITDKLDFREGIRKLQETTAYGLYYRLGKEIDYCYMQRSYQTVPSLLDVGDGYLTWEINTAQGDWGYPNTVDLTLYPKDAIQEDILSAHFTYPNDFEGHWATSGNKVGLCFERPKMVNVCINTVSEFRGRDDGHFSAQRLNRLFLKGQKIDITPFYHMMNRSPHIEAELKLIRR
jgi:hypothetical protein